MPADAAIATVEQLGPLHGVPIAIKDHIPVRGLKGHQVGDKPAPVSRNDHFGVERLRKSGAIIMGTNSMLGAGGGGALAGEGIFKPLRSEEHTSELQSHMRLSYAVFCLKKQHTQ